MQTLDRTQPVNEIKKLSELSSFQNVVYIVLEWLSIFLTIYVTQQFFNPLTYVLAVMWLGSRYHALGVLMHEAVHYRLFKNRKANEIVGEILAWPTFLTMQGYRNSHLAHHQNLNGEDDPDFNQWDKYYQFPKTKLQMLGALLENALGVGYLYDITQTLFKHQEQFKVQNTVPLPRRVAQLLFLGALVGSAIAFSFWQLLILYWIIPLLTITKFCDYVRGIAEHYAMESSHELNSTRNTFGWESYFIAPYKINVHLAHHLYPGVPWYNLSKLHAVLMKDPEYKRSSKNATGYLQVFDDCTRYKKTVD